VTNGAEDFFIHSLLEFGPTRFAEIFGRMTDAMHGHSIAFLDWLPARITRTNKSAAAGTVHPNRGGWNLDDPARDDAILRRTFS
jgi:hypothetical protein